jgi:hypothetical protein
MQLTDEQRERALALLEHMTWGDMDGYIRDLEAALRLALEATTEDFRRWDSAPASHGGMERAPGCQTPQVQ